MAADEGPDEDLLPPDPFADGELALLEDEIVADAEVLSPITFALGRHLFVAEPFVDYETLVGFNEATKRCMDGDTEPILAWLAARLGPASWATFENLLLNPDPNADVVVTIDTTREILNWLGATYLERLHDSLAHQLAEAAVQQLVADWSSYDDPGEGW